jgi:hypothetical protein
MKESGSEVRPSSTRELLIGRFASGGSTGKRNHLGNAKLCGPFGQIPNVVGLSSRPNPANSLKLVFSSSQKWPPQRSTCANQTELRERRQVATRGSQAAIPTEH